MIVINRAEILNTIAKECHYDSGEPLEAYSRLLSLINNYEGTDIVNCKDCKYFIVSPDFSCCKLTEAIVGEDDFCSKGGKVRIGLIDVDGHNYPNLPLMKISAWHKAQGDQVEWYSPLISGHMDKVYMSKVFSFTPDYEFPIDADEINRGGRDTV